MSDEVEIRVLEDGEVAEEGEPLGLVPQEKLDELADYLKKEYDTAATEMDARNQKAMKWRRNMEALASDAPKNHPYKNSSNVTVPVTQILGQALAAKVLGTFDAREPLWDILSTRHDEEDTKTVKVIGKFLNMLARSPTDLNMELVLQDLVQETILIGGSFPKVAWTTESWRVIDKNGAQTDVTLHDGPEVIVVPVEKVKYRRGVGKISRLPWIGVDTELTEVELRKKAAEGQYDLEAVEKILKSEERTAPTESEEQRQQAEMFDSGEMTPLFDITEFWVYFDYDDSGVPVDMFVTMHVASGTILKVQFNTIGMRAIVASRYVHRFQSLTGRGVGQMTEGAQSEVTAIHNMRNDNMKLANTRMVVMKRGGPLQANEEIYPGKILRSDNPREDVVPLQLGEVYPSSLQAENMSLQYAQRTVGLSDTAMGFADQTLKSRDTVRGQSMRIQQGDSVLGGAIAGLRSVLSQIGMLVWIQCVANKERVMAKERAAMRLSEEELELLQKALDMSVAEVPMKLAFTVKISDAERTFEQQRMNMMTLTQIMAQFGQQTVPLAMQLYGPEGMQMKQQAPELYSYLGRLMVGSAKLVEDIFKFFDIHNTKDYLPDSERMDRMLDLLDTMVAATQGAGQVQGMIAPPQGTGAGVPGAAPTGAQQAMAAGPGVEM